jgi:hypothetical protein
MLAPELPITLYPGAPITDRAVARGVFTIHDLAVGGLGAFGRPHPTHQTELGERPLAYTPDPQRHAVFVLAHSLTPKDTAEEGSRIASRSLPLCAFNIPTQVLVHAEQSGVIREAPYATLAASLQFEVPAVPGEPSHFVSYGWEVRDAAGEESPYGQDLLFKDCLDEEERLAHVVGVVCPFLSGLIVPQLLEPQPNDQRRQGPATRHRRQGPKPRYA